MPAALQVDFILSGVIDATNGLPLAGGKVTTYEAGTTTPKTTWQDSNKATAHANPIILDSQGKALVFADGSYKFKIDNSADVNQETRDGLTYDPVADANRAAKSVSSNYTLLTTDDLILATVGGITMTLPSVATAVIGREYIIIHSGAVGSVVTITPNAADQIDGKGLGVSVTLTRTVVVDDDFSSFTLRATSANNWVSLGHVDANKLSGQQKAFYLARANHTGTQAPSTISPQGAGSTLDADLLDAQSGSFYLARANHTGTQAASTISPQGAGSTLDADLLDGINSSSFARIDATATFTVGPVLSNNVFLKGKKVDATVLNILSVDAANITQVGNSGVVTNVLGSSVQINGSIAVSRTDTAAVKAWGNITTPTTVNQSLNITSVTNPSTGTYVVNWTAAFASVTYAVIAISNSDATPLYTTIVTTTTGSATVKFFDAAGTATNPVGFYIAAFGL